MTAEEDRLQEARDCGTPWRKWGPYLRERQWGIARERLHHECAELADIEYTQACSCAYEWGEDGLAGICDEQMRLCFAIGLWNGVDPILKERLGPATGSGEAPKDACIYLDNVPTHSYMRALYKYSDRFDVFVEYAKASAEEILIRITVDNRGSEPARLHVLPHLWFRNTWHRDPRAEKPIIEQSKSESNVYLVARHPSTGPHYLQYETQAEALFTDNDTPVEQTNSARHFKDGISKFITSDTQDVSETPQSGTKAAIHYELMISPSRSRTIRLKLGAALPVACPLAPLRFDSMVQQRRREANQFYAALTQQRRDERFSRTFRRAFATALWSKQTYLYDIRGWLCDRGRGKAVSLASRTKFHLTSSLVFAMPETWRAPRPGESSSILHALALANIDADLAFNQLEARLRADYVDGTPVAAEAVDVCDTSLHAWAVLLMYRMQQAHQPRRAFDFLRRAFNLLRVRESRGVWVGLQVQSLFEIAVELALVDVQYERAAIELYLRFATVVASLDVDGRQRESRTPSELRSPRGQLASAVAAVSVCAAAMFPETVYKRLPQLIEYVHALTSGSALPFRPFKPLKANMMNGRRVLSIVDECTLRALLARLANLQDEQAAKDSAVYSLPCGVVLLRALLCLHDCHGGGLQTSASRRHSLGTLLEWSREVAQRIRVCMPVDSGGNDGLPVESRADPHWHELMSFYEQIFAGQSDGTARNGWAGVIAPLLCRAFDYQIFERAASNVRPEIRVVYRRPMQLIEGEESVYPGSFGRCGVARADVSSEQP
jgi:hypothetical protein